MSASSGLVAELDDAGEFLVSVDHLVDDADEGIEERDGREEGEEGADAFDGGRRDWGDPDEEMEDDDVGGRRDDEEYGEEEGDWNDEEDVDDQDDEGLDDGVRAGASRTAGADAGGRQNSQGRVPAGVRGSGASSYLPLASFPSQPSQTRSNSIPGSSTSSMPLTGNAWHTLSSDGETVLSFQARPPGRMFPLPPWHNSANARRLWQVLKDHILGLTSVLRQFHLLLQAKEMAERAIAAGRVRTTIQKGESVPYHEQGQQLFYTLDALRARRALSNHPDVVDSIRQHWLFLTSHKPLGQRRVTRDEYIRFFGALQQRLLPSLREAEARQSLEEDWRRDSRDRDLLDYASFHNALFELIDNWCDTIEPNDYVHFCDDLFAFVQSHFQATPQPAPKPTPAPATIPKPASRSTATPARTVPPPPRAPTTTAPPPPPRPKPAAPTPTPTHVPAPAPAPSAPHVPPPQPVRRMLPPPPAATPAVERPPLQRAEMLRGADPVELSQRVEDRGIQRRLRRSRPRSADAQSRAPLVSADDRWADVFALEKPRVWSAYFSASSLPEQMAFMQLAFLADSKAVDVAARKHSTLSATLGATAASRPRTVQSPASSDVDDHDDDKVRDSTLPMARLPLPPLRPDPLDALWSVDSAVLNPLRRLLRPSSASILHARSDATRPAGAVEAFPTPPVHGRPHRQWVWPNEALPRPASPSVFRLQPSAQRASDPTRPTPVVLVAPPDADATAGAGAGRGRRASLTFDAFPARSPLAARQATAASGTAASSTTAPSSPASPAARGSRRASLAGPGGSRGPTRPTSALIVAPPHAFVSRRGSTGGISGATALLAGSPAAGTTFTDTPIPVVEFTDAGGLAPARRASASAGAPHRVSITAAGGRRGSGVFLPDRALELVEALVNRRPGSPPTGALLAGSSTSRPHTSASAHSAEGKQPFTVPSIAKGVREEAHVASARLGTPSSLVGAFDLRARTPLRASLGGSRGASATPLPLSARLGTAQSAAGDHVFDALSLDAPPRAPSATPEGIPSPTFVIHADSASRRPRFAEVLQLDVSPTRDPGANSSVAAGRSRRRLSNASAISSARDLAPFRSARSEAEDAPLREAALHEATDRHAATPANVTISGDWYGGGGRPGTGPRPRSLSPSQRPMSPLLVERSAGQTRRPLGPALLPPSLVALQRLWQLETLRRQRRRFALRGQTMAHVPTAPSVLRDFLVRFGPPSSTLVQTARLHPRTPGRLASSSDLSPTTSTRGSRTIPLSFRLPPDGTGSGAARTRSPGPRTPLRWAPTVRTGASGVSEPSASAASPASDSRSKTPAGSPATKAMTHSAGGRSSSSTPSAERTTTPGLATAAQPGTSAGARSKSPSGRSARAASPARRTAREGGAGGARSPPAVSPRTAAAPTLSERGVAPVLRSTPARPRSAGSMLQGLGALDFALEEIAEPDLLLHTSMATGRDELDGDASQVLSVLESRARQLPGALRNRPSTAPEPREVSRLFVVPVSSSAGPADRLIHPDRVEWLGGVASDGGGDDDDGDNDEDRAASLLDFARTTLASPNPHLLRTPTGLEVPVQDGAFRALVARGGVRLVKGPDPVPAPSPVELSPSLLANLHTWSRSSLPTRGESDRRDWRSPTRERGAWRGTEERGDHDSASLASLPEPRAPAPPFGFQQRSIELQMSVAKVVALEFPVIESGNGGSGGAEPPAAPGLARPRTGGLRSSASAASLVSSQPTVTAGSASVLPIRTRLAEPPRLLRLAPTVRSTLETSAAADSSTNWRDRVRDKLRSRAGRADKSTPLLPPTAALVSSSGPSLPASASSSFKLPRIGRPSSPVRWTIGHLAE